jgi:choline dehydrogenase
MLSGIGPPELLRRHGIEVVHALPGVGRNLQDHPAVFEMLRVRLPTLVASDRTWRAPWHALRWLLRGDGPAAGAAMIASGYLRSDPAEREPDLYLQLAAFAMQLNPGGRLRFTPEPAITTIMSIARPHGRGTLEITSAEPLAPLRGALELLGDERDRQRLVVALRLIRRIHGAPALQREAAGGSRSPPAGQSEEDLLAQVVATAGAQYHPVGSCRMGSDELAVVDPRLRVRGIAGLHVADASIMPRLTSGNTNAPVLMIAERAVDFIRQGPAERAESVSIAPGAETLACP